MRPTTSASNLFRRKLCPGSAKLEDGLPDQDTDQANEGRLLHDYMAHPEYDRAMLRPFLRDLLSKNENIIDSVFQRILRFCPGTRKEDIALVRELAMENEIITGTADLVFGFPLHATLLINDTKFGFKIVERAELNLQLRSYAVLGYDWLQPHPQRVFVSISQPRLTYDERLTVAEYSPADIEKSRIQIALIQEESSKPKAKRFAGEEQCRYCKAKLICPEFRKVFGPLVPKKSDMFLGFSKTLREATLEKRMAALSDADLEKVLVALTFANMVRAIASEEARRRINAGKLKNYTTAKDFEEREIANTQRAFSLLEMADILPREELYELCTLPIGAVVEAYRKKTECTWKEAETKIEIILAETIERIPRKGRLMRK